MRSWLDLLPKVLVACALALALPAAASAAVPAGITGPATIAENVTGGKATYTIECGTTPPLLAGPDIPNVGTLTVAVSPGPAPNATAGSDYGDPSTTTITCPPVAGATVDVPILNDSADEPGEKYTVRITGTLAALLGNPPSTDVDKSITTTITDDDVPEASLAPLAAVLEGDNPTAQLNVTLSQTPVEPATIHYSTDNFSALAGSDYTATSGDLTIPAGQTVGTISIPILDDAAPEKAEAFYVNLGDSATNATVNPTKKQGTVAIFDKDKPPAPTFSLPKGTTVTEGNRGTINALFTITLAEATTQKVSVDWKTVNFTANTADYEIGHGTVTFAAGETAKTISVNVKGDLRDEPTEAFGVVLGNPVGGAIGAGKSFGIVTDDDGPKVGVGKPVVVRKRALVSVITCPQTADLCRGTIVATVGKVKYGAASFELAKGKGGKVKIKLSRKARRALRKKARRVTFTATAADASGAARVVVRKFRVKRIR